MGERLFASDPEWKTGFAAGWDQFRHRFAIAGENHRLPILDEFEGLRKLRLRLVHIHLYSYPIALQREEAAGTLIRPRMEIAAGGRDAGVAQGRLDQMNRRPTIERVRSVRMPEPVR